MRFLALPCAVGMFVSAIPASLLTVEGAVANPGSIEFTQKMRLKNAIGLAGGTTTEANLKRVVLVSNGEERVYDLTKLGPTPFVEPDDVVFIEQIDRAKHIDLKGAVHRPAIGRPSRSSRS